MQMEDAYHADNTDGNYSPILRNTFWRKIVRPVYSKMEIKRQSFVETEKRY